ncbi:hydroxymethylbilane synthase [Candidatus Aerophobetes bacterium]|uniref:Hydroxymethylbilane synthase n=1 Tax=Aerophobetes bacterium TaxID=2030807 RepID=A0A2A4WY84_UNCAE|nr:MAG: hydroxymethylbilane synthase [Candidatus Aerophobetes bacterium]
MIKIVARNSKLSKIQVQEVIDELLEKKEKDLTFEKLFLQAQGDKDLATSLKDMDHNDFFTQEIDMCVIEGISDVAIHSAKDLPQQLDENLHIVALTQGVDSADVIVIREGFDLNSLPLHARIGSSSKRRDSAIAALRPDFIPVDIRGTIEQRLDLVKTEKLHAVVIAKAALIRLNLTCLNYEEIPGPTAQYQGQLAIVARKDNTAMQSVFASIDYRKKFKKVVYFGLTPPKGLFYTHHVPLIEVSPLPLTSLEKSPLRDLASYTHLIFTSMQGVKFFFKACETYSIDSPVLFKKIFIAIGPSTKSALEKEGVKSVLMPSVATQEGLSSLLATIDLTHAYCLLPSAKITRVHLTLALSLQGVRFKKYPLYETSSVKSKFEQDIDQFDQYIFTSPSTVEAYRENYAKWPSKDKVKAIGPITDRKLKLYL